MSKPKPKSRATVCLLSPHPLMLMQFEKLLSSNAFDVQVQRLDTAWLAGRASEIDIPPASLYVIDAYSVSPSVSLVGLIQERFPASHIVAISESFSETDAYPLLRMGAKGIVTFKEAEERLPEALQVVSAGGFWVPRLLLSGFVDSIISGHRERSVAGAPAGVSRREREVLDCLLENLSNKEIASKLNISERTAKFHVSNLLAKFHVRRRSDLILQSFQSLPAEARIEHS